jgi:DNA invertase Pin-like site-specific DNA recombinase
MRVITYRRVSTDEQADSGLGLAAQTTQLEAAVAARGWPVVLAAVDEGMSAKDMRRPALQDALERLDAGEADVLMVAKLDRLSRSTLDFASLLERAAKKGWRVVALDTDVDPTTPMGEAITSIAVVFAQLERRMISARTKAAMAEAKAQGRRLGRPVQLDEATRARIAEMRARGMSMPSIAATLTDEGVPTVRGGATWRVSSVQSVLRSIELEAKRAAIAEAVA